MVPEGDGNKLIRNPDLKSKKIEEEMVPEGDGNVLLSSCHTSRAVLRKKWSPKGTETTTGEGVSTLSVRIEEEMVPEGDGNTWVFTNEFKNSY